MGEGQQHNLGNHQFLSTLNVKSSSNLKHLSDETVYRRKTFEEIGETLLNRNRDSSAKKTGTCTETENHRGIGTGAIRCEIKNLGVEEIAS